MCPAQDLKRFWRFPNLLLLSLPDNGSVSMFGRQSAKDHTSCRNCICRMCYCSYIRRCRCFRLSVDCYRQGDRRSASCFSRNGKIISSGKEIRYSGGSAGSCRGDFPSIACQCPDTCWGSPTSETLPAGSVQVGCVTAPISGACGRR